MTPFVDRIRDFDWRFFCHQHWHGRRRGRQGQQYRLLIAHRVRRRRGRSLSQRFRPNLRLRRRRKPHRGRLWKRNLWTRVPRRVRRRLEPGRQRRGGRRRRRRGRIGQYVVECLNARRTGPRVRHIRIERHLRRRMIRRRWHLLVHWGRRSYRRGEYRQRRRLSRTRRFCRIGRILNRHRPLRVLKKSPAIRGGFSMGYDFRS